MIPETIGRYRLLSPIDQDRAGVVYRAVEQETSRPVALKLIPAEKFPTPAAQQRFLEDARAAAALSHPHLRRLLEAGEAEGGAYLVFEHLEGAALKTLLVPGPVDAEAALAWSAELVEALAAAHAADLVHGELSSSKVFITRDGTVKLLDTGLWRAAVPSGVDLTVEGKLAESGLPASLVAVLAPEQLRGDEPSLRSDLFALGVLLYEITTAQHPFAHPDAVQTMHWVLKRAPEPPSRLQPALPAALDAIIARALEKNPAARFASAHELAEALRAVAAGEPVALPAAAPEELPEESARRVVLRLTAPLWMGIIALVVLAVLWFLFLALRQP